MPTGPGGLDANGVWQYGEDDTEALASDLLNLGMGSVSTVVGGLGAPTILQVVSATKTDTYSASTATYTDITGLTASITPNSTSSKILVMTDIKVSVRDDNSQGVFVRLSGGNSANYVGDASSSRVQAASGYSDRQADFAFSRSAVPISITYLDSPATTSSTTYSAQIRSADGSIAYVNRSYLDVDSTRGIRTASTITLMEVAG